MELFLALIVLPAFGVIWFFNLLTFMERLHKGKNTRSQRIWGGFCTFIFIAAAFYCMIGISGY